MVSRNVRLSTLSKKYSISTTDICSLLNGMGFDADDNPAFIIPGEIIPQLENALMQEGYNVTHNEEGTHISNSQVVPKNVKEKVARIICSIEDEKIPGKKGTWVLMAKIPSSLDEQMVFFKEYGFDRLKSFLDDNEYLSIYSDTSKEVVRHFVQSKLKVEKEVSSVNLRKETSTNSSITVRNFSEGTIPNIKKWAWLGNESGLYQSLRDLALPENWGDYKDKQLGIIRYPVLENYFKYTFVKCFREDKIFKSVGNELAVFNTGLVDNKYKDIYALFFDNKYKDIYDALSSANPRATQSLPWHFYAFCVEGEEFAGKLLVKKFEAMPTRAEYFKDKFDLLYDTNQEHPKLDSFHIIVENVDRLPYEFIKMNAPRDFSLLSPEELKERTKDLGEWDKEEFYNNYYDSLRDAIKKDPLSMRRMFSDIKEAMDVAIKRVEWNYKAAIPMYWPRGDKMCLFLPLCLLEENKVDIALVVNKTESGRYQGETIYKLDWAYKCARLVCRPDSDWLSIEKMGDADFSSNSDDQEFGNLENDH